MTFGKVYAHPHLPYVHAGIAPDWIAGSRWLPCQHSEVVLVHVSSTVSSTWWVGWMHSPSSAVWTATTHKQILGPLWLKWVWWGVDWILELLQAFSSDPNLLASLPNWLFYWNLYTMCYNIYQAFTFSCIIIIIILYAPVYKAWSRRGRGLYFNGGTKMAAVHIASQHGHGVS